VLTDKAVKGLVPKQKPYKKADEKGLYVLVQPGGSKLWRVKFRYGGKEKLLALGMYPEVPLRLARERRDAARAQLARDADPSAERRDAKAVVADTFAAIADAWLKAQRLSAGTSEQTRRRLAAHLLPYLGHLPIREIAAPDLLRVIRKIEARGTHATAHRIRALCGGIFRFAIATGQADRDPAADLRGALIAAPSGHFASLTDPRKIGALLRAIDGYAGQPAVMFALRLAPLAFVRPGELRSAEWTEFDFEAAEWRIPASRMKMGTPHVVPLASQAIAILNELRLHTGQGRLLFPGLRTTARPISNGTLNAALRRLGYAADEMTAHGFRSMASTALNELGWPPDVIELQLAHQERNKVRASYNKASRLAERKKMMQAWADYLDVLRAGGAAKVRSIRG